MLTEGSRFKQCLLGVGLSYPIEIGLGTKKPRRVAEAFEVLKMFWMSITSSSIRDERSK